MQRKKYAKETLFGTLMVHYALPWKGFMAYHGLNPVTLGFAGGWDCWMQLKKSEEMIILISPRRTHALFSPKLFLIAVQMWLGICISWPALYLFT